MAIGVEYVAKHKALWTKDLAHGHAQKLASCRSQEIAEFLADCLNRHIKQTYENETALTSWFTYAETFNDPRC